MSWNQGPWLGVDFESTGVDPLAARIVTACVAYRSEADAGWTKEWLADAGGELIPEQATAIHGVTSERAHSEGQPVIDVAEAVRELLQEAWVKDVPVVAMNCNYDLSLLNAELVRAGHRELTIDGPVLDPLTLDRMVDRYRKGKRTLGALCEHYHVPLSAAAPGEDATTAAGAHDATADTLAALRLVWRIGNAYPDLAAMPLGELHDAQAKAHESFAINLTDYFRSIGKDERVDTDWPLRRIPSTTGATTA